MGNRAYVVFTNEKETEFSPAVYLHWNGGPESVYTFIRAMQEYQCRGMEDLSYSCARFIQIVGNFFGGSLSLGIENVCDKKDLERFTPGDNGLYLVKLGKTPTFQRMLTRYVKHEEQIYWLTPEQVNAEYTEAINHKYNENDSLMKDIKEKNDSHFIEKKIV